MGVGWKLTVKSGIDRGIEGKRWRNKIENRHFSTPYFVWACLHKGWRPVIRWEMRSSMNNYVCREGIGEMSEKLQVLSECLGSLCYVNTDEQTLSLFCAVSHSPFLLLSPKYLSILPHSFYTIDILWGRHECMRRNADKNGVRWPLMPLYVCYYDSLATAIHDTSYH